MLRCIFHVPLLFLTTAVAQKTAVQTVTPQDVALISNNVTASQDAPFQLYGPAFNKILGHNASLTLLLHDSRPLFHEAGVFVDGASPSIYVVSNQFDSPSPSPATNNKIIVITHITQDNSSGAWTYKVIQPSPPLLLANGGFFYNNGILFTTQGDLKTPGGLVHMSLEHADGPHPRYPTTKVLNNYLGLPFNSLNDVYVTHAGRAYFTDPPYGFAQDIRPAPELPPQVYSYRPGSTDIRVVSASGISHPNGVTFSPDEQTAYVTDGTGVYAGDAKPRLIWAFDIVRGSLANRRPFAQPAVGIPDGIKTDARGNVYAGCGDGVNVWSPDGLLLGKILVAGGSSNFALGPDGLLFLLNEERLWLARLSPHVQPAVVNRLS